MKKIGVLGCGRVGLPLAKVLVKKGFDVNGSVRSHEKILKLSNLGINFFKYNVDQNFKDSHFFKSLDLLIITIPFGRINIKSKSFHSLMSQLIDIIKKESIKKVIYLSSISVYGKKNDLVNEKTQCKPITKSSIKIHSVEQILNSGPFITVNIRLGGLIGEKFHPIDSLSGKTFDKGNQLINLIHVDDVISIIIMILNKYPKENNVFNAVCPYHPSKKDYYTLTAKKLKLAPPKFIDGEKSSKIISSKKIIKYLGYNFKKINLLFYN